jgi:hypothetical protein
MKKIIILLILVLLLGFAFAETFYPTTIGELDAKVTLHGNGTIKNLEEGIVNFQTLTFQESDFQDIKIIKEELYINGKTIYPEYLLDEFGNKHVKFEIPYNGDFVYELSARVKTKGILYEVNDYNIKDFPENIQEYLKRSTTIESSSSEILTVSENNLRESEFTEILNQVIFWVNDYVEYADDKDFQKYYLLQRSAIETLISAKGVCDEFSNLAAALLRAKGIPTRLVIGITFDGKEWGNHAWLEVYHKDLGWIPSDPTFREPGFVDATHIKMGSFPDVTLSLAKATFPTGTDVIFQTQTLPEVTILSKEFFNNAILTWEKKDLKAKQWNEITINVKNNTTGKLTIPLKINETNFTLKDEKGDLSPFDLIFKERTKSITLEGGEEGEVSFFIFPNVNLNKNSSISGVNLKINSLSEPYEINFKINSGEPTNKGEVKVKEIVPITLDTKLRLEIRVQNNFPEEKDIKITVDENYEWTENLPALTNTIIQKEVNLGQKEYEIQITTPSEIYTKKVFPILNNITPTDNKNKENIIIQKIENKQDNNTQEFGPEIIIFILLPIFAIALLIVFATRKRYV